MPGHTHSSDSPSSSSKSEDDDDGFQDIASMRGPSLTPARKESLAYSPRSTDKSSDTKSLLRQKRKRQIATASKSSDDKGKGKDVEAYGDADEGSEKIDRVNPFPEKWGESVGGFLGALALLVLLGVRPKRIGTELRDPKKDPVKVWTALRDSLCKRYVTIGTMSGLMLAATGTMTPPTEAERYLRYDYLHRLPYAFAVTGRFMSLVSAAFATGLALVLAEADPADFRNLAAKPYLMIVALSTPAAGAINSFVLFYLSMAATQLTEGDVLTRLSAAVMGLWALLMILFCVILFHEIGNRH